MAFPSSSASLVPRALSLVKKRFPDITVTFSEAEPPESLAALRAGECDIAVAFAYEGGEIARGEDLDFFVTRKLIDDEVRLAVPKGHALAGKDGAELADFADESWIAGCPRCRGHLLSLSQRAGFVPWWATLTTSKPWARVSPSRRIANSTWCPASRSTSPSMATRSPATSTVMTIEALFGTEPSRMTRAGHQTWAEMPSKLRSSPAYSSAMGTRASPAHWCTFSHWDGGSWTGVARI